MGLLWIRTDIQPKMLDPDPKICESGSETLSQNVADPELQYLLNF
jgi:hypothetical protein